MKMHRIVSLAAGSLFIAGTALAQTPAVAAHPRVTEVEKRIDNQEKRIDQGVANGTLTEEQAAKGKEKLDATQAKLEKDKAEHNGHITKKEQVGLNKKLNHSSRKIHKEKES